VTWGIHFAPPPSKVGPLQVNWSLKCSARPPLSGPGKQLSPGSLKSLSVCNIAWFDWIRSLENANCHIEFLDFPS
jgi:hypothetical protein